MAKIVYSLRDQIWVQTPRLMLLSEWKKKDFDYLEAFCLVGQHAIIKKYLNDGGEAIKNDPNIDYFKKELVLGLGDRIEILNFFGEKLTFQQGAVLAEGVSRDASLIYDTKTNQKFLSYLFAYVNALYAIHDFIGNIDKLLGVDFWKKILKKDASFSIPLAIRHAFVHHETPLVALNESHTKIVLIFNHMNRVKNRFIRFLLPWLIEKNKQIFEFDIVDSQEIRGVLNEWAKMHLQRVPPDEVISFIDEHRTNNGSLRFVEMTFEDVMVNYAGN